jgi:gliding motility-associated-like protein
MFTKGATAVLPSNSLPSAPEYIVTTNESTLSSACFSTMGWKPQTCSEFLIVGIANESVIEIFPNSGSLHTPTKAYHPITIKLRKGETYFYIAAIENGVKMNLTGSVIRSKTEQSKFAVFAGNKMSGSTLKNRLNQNCNQLTDHVFEQLTPTANWGKSYIAIPFKKSKGGYFLRIVAQENNTHVRINNGAVLTLQAGSLTVHNVNSDTATYVQADKNISVAQFSKAPGCSEIPGSKSLFGNLSMVYLAANEQYTFEAMVNPVDHKIYNKADTLNKPEFYINILSKTADTAYFLINGIKPAQSNWIQKSLLSGYSYIQWPFDSTLLLKSSKGFIAYMYAYKRYEGYSMTIGAGHRLTKHNFIFDRFCKNDTSTFIAVQSDSIYGISWRMGNDPTLLSGDKVRYTFKDTGYYTVTMYSRLKSSNSFDTISKRIYIYSADQTPVLSNDTLICGQIGFIMACRNLDYYKSYLWNGGHPYYAQYIKNPGLYHVTVTERSGCSFRDSVVVSSKPRPRAGFISDSLICTNLNTPVQFINTSQHKDSIVSNVWTFGTGNPIDTAVDTLLHIFSKPGHYSIRLITESFPGCADTAVRKIFVNGEIKAEFSLSDTVACLKDNLFTLKDLSKSDTGQIGFHYWTFSDKSSISTTDSFTKTFNDTGYKTITLLVSNNFGCKDSISKQVQIYKDIQTQILVNDASQCQNKQDFDFTLRAPVNANSIRWYYENDSSLSTDLLNIRFKTTGLQTVYVIAGDKNKCIGRDSLQIAVNAVPFAGFTCSDTMACLRLNRFTFTNNSKISSGKIQAYKWLFGDGTTSLQKDPATKTYSDTGTFSIEMICVSDSACTDTTFKTIHIHPSVKLQIANILPVCLKDSSVFNAQFLSGSANARTAVWYFGDGASDSGLNQKHAYNGSGQYKARITTLSDKACKDTFDAPNNAIVNRLPLVSFTSMFKDGGQNNTLASFSNTSPSYRYLNWDFSAFGTATGSDTTLNLSDSVSLKVRLKVTDWNGCSNTEEKIIFIGSPISVYIPNVFSPNGDGHNDYFGPEGIEYAFNYTFTVYNRWGEIVFLSHQNGEKWDGSFMNDEVPNGVYIYTLEFRDFYRILHEAEGSFLLKR